MAKQIQYFFDITTNTTTVIVPASNGVVINAFESTFNTTLASASCQVALQDANGVNLFNRVYRGQTAGGAVEFVSLSGLNIATTSFGGLQIVSLGFAAGDELLGSIIYTVP